MVKHKRVPDSEEEEPAVKEEVGGHADAADPPSKKSRPSSSTAVEVKQNDDGKPYIELSDWRRLTISNYKGKTLVDIREVGVYYKDKSSGEMKPGSKGISLTTEQWAKVKHNLDVVDQMMADSE